MDSDTGGGKSKFDFSDIMSMLDDGAQAPQKKPEAQPVAPAKKAETPRSDAFAQKLLADIERKNAEILKLNSENMSLKYSLSERDIEIKKLRAQSDTLTGQVEGLKAQVTGLNQQVEDLNRFVNDARSKLGEMDADRAKLTTRMVAKEAEPAPPEEDVASIFKRIALKAQEPEEQKSGDNADGNAQALKRLSTAKLYDL